MQSFVAQQSALSGLRHSVRCACFEIDELEFRYIPCPYLSFIERKMLNVARLSTPGGWKIKTFHFRWKCGVIYANCAIKINWNLIYWRWCWANLTGKSERSAKKGQSVGNQRTLSTFLIHPIFRECGFVLRCMKNAGGTSAGIQFQFSKFTNKLGTVWPTCGGILPSICGQHEIANIKLCKTIFRVASISNANYTLNRHCISYERHQLDGRWAIARELFRGKNWITLHSTID